MSALAIIVAGLLPVAIGSAPALWLRERPSAWTVITDSLLWGLAVMSAIAWFPPLRSLRFDVWLFVCFGLALSSSVAAVFLRRKMIPFTPLDLPFARRVLYTATLTAFTLYLIMCSTRPGVDWDAVNYYLFAAVDFATSNHVGLLFSHHVTMAAHAPNELPPLIPVWYGQAINIASIAHADANDTIRLIPLVLLVATWAAIRRVARVYFEPVYADGGALLFVTLPAIVNQIAVFALYVDLAMTFVFVMLVAELVSQRIDAATYVRIGLLGTLALIAKVSGPVLISLAFLALVASQLPRRVAALALIALSGLGLIGVAAMVGDFNAPGKTGRVVAILATLLVALWTASSFRTQLTFRSPAALLTAIALLPGALYVWQLSRLLGSPAGYYVSSWAHVQSPNFAWALAALHAANTYGWNQQLGLPEHYGIGLLLWWGLAPITNVLAIAGALIAIRRQHPIASLVLLIALFYLAWLTVLNLIDFRHLLPVMCFLPILAAYCIRTAIQPDASRAHWAFLGVVLCAVPFMWLGQWPYNRFPIELMSRYRLDPGHALTTAGLVAIALFTGVVCAAFAAGRKVTAGLRRVPRLPKTLERFGVIAASAIVILLGFEPVIATALTIGLRDDSANTRAQYYFGYYPALQELANIQKAGSIVTFSGYGVSWYTVGLVRKIDLADALDLGILRPALESTEPANVSGALSRSGADWGIIPAADSPVGAEFIALMRGARLPGMNSLMDPTSSTQLRRGAWTMVHLHPPSFGPPGMRAQLSVRAAAHDIAAPQETQFFKSFASDGFVMGISGVKQVAAFTVRVEGTKEPPGDRYFEYATVAHTTTPTLISFAAIADFLARQNHRTARSLSIQSISADVRDTHGHEIARLHWQSPRFSVSLGLHHRWVRLAGDSAFALRPDLAPLSFISTSSGSSNPGDDTLVFPSRQAVYGAGPRFDTLEVGLAASGVCAAGEPLTVSFTGARTLAARDNTHLSTQRLTLKRLARAGAVLRIPARAFFELRAPSGGLQNVLIEQIAVEGSASCPLRQIVTGGLQLQRDGNDIVLRNEIPGLVTFSLRTPDSFAAKSRVLPRRQAPR